MKKRDLYEFDDGLRRSRERQITADDEEEGLRRATTISAASCFVSEGITKPCPPLDFFF
jgi:hypothetical protein